MSNSRGDNLTPQITLLPTKLYIPPARNDLVQRRHLTDRLNESLQRKFTLISAPAGFSNRRIVREAAAFPPEQAPAAIQTHKTAAALPASYLVDPLSARELEILKPLPPASPMTRL